MEKSLVKQFKAVLSIVSDYPGIEDIIDLERAKNFLAELQKLEPLVSGSIEAGEPPEKTLKEGVTSRLEAWRELFSHGFYEWDELNADELLSGKMVFYNHPTDDEIGSMVLALKTNNQASLIVMSNKETVLKDFSGTWAEVYAYMNEVDEGIIPPVLEESLEEATKELDSETVIKWGKLLSSIPIFHTGWTTVKEVYETAGLPFDSEDQEHEDHVFHILFWAAPEPAQQFLTSRFMPGNKAYITEEVAEGRVDVLEDRNVYGFEGTWEEVALKIIETSNFILNPGPPFTL